MNRKPNSITISKTVRKLEDIKGNKQPKTGTNYKYEKGFFKYECKTAKRACRWQVFLQNSPLIELLL